MSEYHEGLDKGIELFKRESAELRAQVAALQADLARVTAERDAVKETLLGESGERCVNSIIKLANIAEKFQRSSEKAEAALAAEREKNAALKNDLEVHRDVFAQLEAERARANGLQERLSAYLSFYVLYENSGSWSYDSKSGTSCWRISDDECNALDSADREIDRTTPPAVEKPIYMLNDDKHEQGIADAAREVSDEEHRLPAP